MAKREFITARAQLLADGDGGSRARVPSTVRDRLGAARGDWLVFEEGCDAAVTRAAIAGPYFVVRRVPGVPEPAAQQVSAVAQVEEGQQQEVVPPPDIESFAEAVARKCRGG